MIYFYILRKILVCHAYSFEIKAQHNYNLFFERESLYFVQLYITLICLFYFIATSDGLMEYTFEFFFKICIFSILATNDMFLSCI